MKKIKYTDEGIVLSLIDLSLDAMDDILVSGLYGIEIDENGKYIFDEYLPKNYKKIIVKKINFKINLEPDKFKEKYEKFFEEFSYKVSNNFNLKLKIKK